MAQRTVTVTLVANIGSFVSSLSRAGAATAGLGALSAKVFGAAGIVGGFGAAIGAASEFESAMSGVQAATMASADTLGQLREAAMQAGADTQYSATEAANAIREMAKAGVSAQDIMGGGLAGALSLAAAGQMEVAQAAEIASVAMVQFGLAGEDLPHVADLLAAGAGKAMGEVSDLGAALNQAGLVASAAGLSIEETTGSLAAFASAGLVGSDAGTSLRSMLQHLQNPSKEAAREMESLGISMYDANGQFVGMEELAGQLRGSMSGLTPAARDAAMAVIFGSDAVRAANVLYSEGSAGIADWTDKVNDSGYAAEQAAILNDNLAGDIERLGGAFDSLMIDMGSGTQGPLRGLVQGLTGLVGVVGTVFTAVSDLPTPLLAGAAAFTGIILLKGPFTAAMAMMGGGLSGLAGRAIAATSSMAAFRAASAGAFALMGGPIGLAIIGISVGLGFLASSSDEAADSTGDLADQQNELTDALQASKGAIDANVRAAAAKELQDHKVLGALEDMGIATSEATDAILGNEEALATLGNRLQIAIDNGTLLTGGMTDEAIAASNARDALYELAGQTEGSIASAQQLSAATAETGSAMVTAAGQTQMSTEALADWLEGLQGVVEGFVDPLDTYKTLLQEKTDAERAQAEAQAAETESMEDSWEDYVDSVDVSLDELAARLQEQLDNQANWRTNLAQIAQWAGVDVATHLAQMGQDGVDIVAQMADGTTAGAQAMREQILREIQMGGGEWTAAMGNEWLILQGIGRDGSARTVQEVARQLGVGVGVVRDIARQYGIELAGGVNPLLRGLGKPGIDISGGINSGGGRAEGGYIAGPGGPTEDKAGLFALSDGEYVIKSASVSKYGLDFMDALNSGRIGHFATGGFVSTSSVPRPPSTAPYQSPISPPADATMEREYDEVTAWLAANLEPPATSGGSASGLLPIMAAARQYVMDTYGVMNIGGYSYRNIAGTSTLSDHALGKAIDIMTSNLSLGWAIANDFAYGPAHSRFAAENVIWQQSISSNGGSFVGMEDRGSPTQNHYDHVHVDTYDKGGWLQPGLTLAYNGTGRPERVMTGREFSGGGGGGSSTPNVTVQARVFIGNREITDIARVEATAVVDQRDRAQARNARSAQ